MMPRQRRQAFLGGPRVQVAARGVRGQIRVTRRAVARRRLRRKRVLRGARVVLAQQVVALGAAALQEASAGPGQGVLPTQCVRQVVQPRRRVQRQHLGTRGGRRVPQVPVLLGQGLAVVRVRLVHRDVRVRVREGPLGVHGQGVLGVLGRNSPPPSTFTYSLLFLLAEAAKNQLIFNQKLS